MSEPPSAPAPPPQPAPHDDAPPDDRARPSGVGTAMLGTILIAVGIVFFVGQQVQIDWGAEAWPFYVIVPGVILLAFGLTQPHGLGMATGGSIVTIVGLILLYQNLTDHWESWAYAWALVGPGGSGVGMLLYGLRSGSGKLMRDGFWQVATALAIFAVAFVFFEGIIGLSGDRWNLPDWLLPAILIGIGVVILVRSVTTGREAAKPAEPSGHESV